ncbi:MAG: hypothetical protein O3C21_09495 [Verrucomicrobia bacterium]|nr:hypothetical protein [Verrucomicrobiota bacterium]
MEDPSTVLIVGGLGLVGRWAQFGGRKPAVQHGRQILRRRPSEVRDYPVELLRCSILIGF